MVQYNCERCNREFKKKYDYLNHINRKFKCIPLLGNIEKEINTIEKDIFKCELCSKIFINRDSLKYHKDNVCKKRCEPKFIEESNVGYIYCITNSVYEKENIYKLGYTSPSPIINSETVKKLLLTRYNCYYINASIKYFEKIYFPKEAEKELFSRLTQYKIQGEMYCVNYIKIILPELQFITNKYILDKIKPTNLKKEMNVKQTYNCQRCNKVFNKKSNYIDHLNRKNSCIPVNAIPERPTCKHCHKIFSRLYSLNRHIQNGCSKANASIEDIQSIKDTINAITKEVKQLRIENNQLQTIYGNDMINNTK